MTPRSIALAGNPNSGKTTLFNALTGLRQRVGNYPGVTVEKKTGRCFGLHGEAFDVLDLPGTYSLQVRSPDEAVARDVLLGRRPDTPRPDVILCVVDATNLERHLYLAAQLLELGLPVLVALNMTDVAEERGLRIDAKALEAELGVPVIPMVAHRAKGLVELKQALSQPLARPTRRARLPTAIETEACHLGNLIARTAGAPPEAVLAEGLALLALPPESFDAHPLPATVRTAMHEAHGRLVAEGIDPVTAPVEARYDWVNRICHRVVHRAGDPSATLSDHLDALLTHRFIGWVAFLAAMGLMFFCIFTLAEYPMGWIEAAMGALSDLARTHIPPGDLRSLVCDGAIAGVSGVLVFLPQILVLFFFIGLLEDTGYMARAAFLMDRVMSKVGLHGRSFIPLLSSFACAIPGILATRTIESRKDRLVTILVAPLMSCSARLPVYAILITTMFPGSVPAEAKAGIMLAMYLIGMIAAFGMAWLFKRTLLKGETPVLLMELPPYRAPSWKGIALQMWHRAQLFIRRAGTVILALSIVLWALATYPKHPDPGVAPAQQLEHSLAGRAGRALEPFIAPLGYDWKIGIGIIGSFAAREVFVSTMGIVYNLEDAEGDTGTLRDAFRAERRPDGRPVFTPLVCIGLMVFYVLAMQCVSTVVITRRETGSWRWALFQAGYMTALAWIAAFVVYQGGRMLGLG
jgi:ferrous iron transport protein B